MHLDRDDGDDKDETTTEGLQIGYKTHVVGSILYGFTLLTWCGWFAILTWLSIQVR
jgi:hypothetical protein